MLIAYFTRSRRLAAWMAVLVALWTQTAALAQDDKAGEEDSPDDAVVQAEPITVTDSLPPEASLLLDDPSASTERIEVDEVRERVRDLADLLEEFAGVRVVSFGGVGRSATVSLRGSSGRQVLVLLDGIPLNAAGEAVDLSTIPLDQLAAVEVTRGGESALYGGAALGGVINLITATPDQSEETRTLTGGARLAIGAFKTIEASLTERIVTDDRQRLMQLQTQHTRGGFAFLNDNGTVDNPDDDFNDRRSNNESAALSFLYKDTWVILDDASFTLTAEGFGRNRGEPGVVTFPSEESKSVEQRWLLDGTWRANDWLLPESVTEIKLFGRRESSRFDDPEGEQTGVPLTTKQRDELLGARFGTSRSTDEDWLWTAFGEVSRETLADKGQDGRTRNTIAGAVRGEYTVSEDLTAVLALRGDQVSDQDTRFSPKLGLIWIPSDTWTLRANAGNSYRPPSFAELSENRGFVVGNPDLVAEVAQTLDLGVSYKDDTAKWGITLFRNQTRDLIEYVQIAGFRFKPLNFGRVLAEGAELSGSWDLDEVWSLDADATLQTVTDQTGGANRDHHQLPGQPRRFGNVTLNYDLDPWEASLAWNWVGPNSVTFSGTRQLPSRETVDASLTYHWAETASLGLQIANLLDDQVADLRGFPLPGRDWTLTYTRHW
ncbi:MAG: TonB-dependent receptor [bacterium]